MSVPRVKCSVLIVVLLTFWMINMTKKKPPNVSRGDKKKKPPKILRKKNLTKRRQNDKLWGRLKDTLWSLRQRFSGMPASVCVDRLTPYVVFRRTVTQEQLNAFFPGFPTRIPEDFQMALIATIRATVQAYWKFTQLGIGQYGQVYNSILKLEHIVRDGFSPYMLAADGLGGYQLTRKPKN